MRGNIVKYHLNIQQSKNYPTLEKQIAKNLTNWLGDISIYR